MRHPAVDLQSDLTLLGDLQQGLMAMTPGADGNPHDKYGSWWLQRSDGTLLMVGASSHEVAPHFEVSTLYLTTHEAWRAALLAHAQPPPPEMDRMKYGDFLEHPLAGAVLAWRAAHAAPPSNFDPWPFATWQVEVLRRSEYLSDCARNMKTFGANPVLQATARPGEEPPDALDSCTVVSGLLFIGGDGGRLLMGAEYPGEMLVSRRDELIDQYLATCTCTTLARYLADQAAS